MSRRIRKMLLRERPLFLAGQGRSLTGHASDRSAPGSSGVAMIRRVMTAWVDGGMGELGQMPIAVAMVSPISAGDWATLMPAASSAWILLSAVPSPPEMIAPA